MGRIVSFRQVAERYPVLRFVAAVCSGIGVILMILGVLLLTVGLMQILRADSGPLNGVGIMASFVWSLGLFLTLTDCRYWKVEWANLLDQIPNLT
jgi:hypothetical protein